MTIGDGCTIGTGAIVTKDVPPYSVAVGKPVNAVLDLNTCHAYAAGLPGKLTLRVSQISDDSTSDVHCRCHVAGNPARVVKTLPRPGEASN